MNKTPRIRCGHQRYVMWQDITTLLHHIIESLSPSTWTPHIWGIWWWNPMWTIVWGTSLMRWSNGWARVVRYQVRSWPHPLPSWVPPRMWDGMQNILRCWCSWVCRHLCPFWWWRANFWSRIYCIAFPRICWFFESFDMCQTFVHQTCCNDGKGLFDFVTCRGRWWKLQTLHDFLKIFGGQQETY